MRLWLVGVLLAGFAVSGSAVLFLAGFSSNVDRGGAWGVARVLPLSLAGDAVAGEARAGEAARQVLEIVTSTTTYRFDVEVAETDRQKAVGLMFRRTLAPMTGMLFPYDEASDLSMWMRNTYIPLDMIFIRVDGSIHRVEANTEPHSETVIRAGAQVTAVLEIPGGEAERLGIGAGDQVVHRHFRTAGR
ncbi:MAG: DUF192 domain-containing protein [Pseudomonadota bacterium]